MSEPLTGTGAATAALTGVTFAGLWAGTDEGVLVGAFAGAAVFVLSSAELVLWKRVGFFIASFFLGILAAPMTTSILSSFTGSMLPTPIEVDKSIGATIAAACAVRLLMAFIKRSEVVSEKISGGGK